MNKHRLVKGTSLYVQDACKPFSCFKFVETYLGDNEAIHRCFSMARTFDMKALTVEEIPAVGLIQDENDEILSLGFSHCMDSLIRLGFWRCELEKTDDLVTCKNSDLIGYAICKLDVVTSPSSSAWHIFEAVFQKYPHAHNCVPDPKAYSVKIGGVSLEVTGILFCQQNALNKACAQVALRSLLSRRLEAGDIAYSTINDHARAFTKDPHTWQPREGLKVHELRGVLSCLGIPFMDIDYCEEEILDLNVRHELPYQKYLYAGVESGSGAMLGFHMDGPEAEKNQRHIIPFFGHTFNQDTWVPTADMDYLNIGGGIGYIPSESWTSSFIGHDDNFGPNFCVPRLYVKPEQVDYVIELLPEGYEYAGIQAEATTLLFILSVIYSLKLPTGNDWIDRLATYGDPETQRIVLRAVAVSRENYLSHLESLTDWDGLSEDSAFLKFLEEQLPTHLWMVEISIPHLFPANERKMGEVLLNPFIAIDSTKPNDMKRFIFARIPGKYLFCTGEENGNPQFTGLPSQLESHTDLLHGNP